MPGAIDPARTQIADQQLITAEYVQDFVALTLSWEWSPEQISGVSHRIGSPSAMSGSIGMWLLTRPGAGSFTSAFAKDASVIERE